MTVDRAFMQEDCAVNEVYRSAVNLDRADVKDYRACARVYRSAVKEDSAGAGVNRAMPAARLSDVSTSSDDT